MSNDQDQVREIESPLSEVLQLLAIEHVELARHLARDLEAPQSARDLTLGTLDREAILKRFDERMEALVDKVGADELAIQALLEDLRTRRTPSAPVRSGRRVSVPDARSSETPVPADREPPTTIPEVGTQTPAATMAARQRAWVANVAAVIATVAAVLVVLFVIGAI